MAGLNSSAGSLSLATGDKLEISEPHSFVERIASRVARNPDGLVRSYRLDGNHITQRVADLWDRAGDVAAALCATGARNGSIVVILADDVLDYVPAFCGCLRGGFIPVALMAAAKDAAFRQDPAFRTTFASFGDPVLLVDDGFAGLIDSRTLRVSGPVLRLSSIGRTAAPWVDVTEAANPAFLIATSGSTGRMKLVALSESTALHRSFPLLPNGPPRPSHGLGLLPFDGVSGHQVAFLGFASWTHMPSQAFYSRPRAVLDAVEAFQVEILGMTSSMLRSIVADEARSPRARNLGSLRHVGLGAEPVHAGTLHAFAEVLRRSGADPGILVAGYGTTETGTLVTGARGLPENPGEPVCLGKPWLGVSMRIVGPDGDILPSGEIGEVEVFCPKRMFSGYWGDPGLTAAGFTADGWWRTRDRGQLVDGQLTLRGRSKEILIRNGRKLALAEMDAEIGAALGVAAVAFTCLVQRAGAAGEELAVAFDAGGALSDADARAAIARALVRRFGITPDLVQPLASDRMPVTANGKIRRDALGALLADLVPQPDVAADMESARGLRETLAAAWCDALALDRAPADDDHFFDLGGDSLRAVSLHLQLQEKLKLAVTVEEFAADPTFGSLLRIAEQAAAARTAPPSRETSPWPLPEAMRRPLMAALRHWPGERATPEGTILGLNREGRRPPLVWVFNDPVEPLQLAEALGGDQPLYAIRSGRDIGTYAEDEVQACALHYAAGIAKLFPAGPVFMGGNCQGGMIALPTAGHLLRRMHHVPLLMLMDWHFPLQPYAGRVLLLSGSENRRHNPRIAFDRPERAWAKTFAETQFDDMPGDYSEALLPGNVDRVADIMRRRMDEALSRPPPVLPAGAYRAGLSVAPVRGTMRVGQRSRIAVTVRNESAVVWARSSVSGIVLRSRWLDPDGVMIERRQPDAELPELRPGDEAETALPIAVPGESGSYTLLIDLCEEGNRWFERDLAKVWSARIWVKPRGGLGRLLAGRSA